MPCIWLSGIRNTGFYCNIIIKLGVRISFRPEVKLDNQVSSDIKISIKFVNKRHLIDLNKKKNTSNWKTIILSRNYRRILLFIYFFSLHITSLEPSDYAYSQAVVENKYSRVIEITDIWLHVRGCLLYTSPSPRDRG